VPLDVVAEAIRRVPTAKYIANYELCLREMEKAKAQRATKPRPAKKARPAKKKVARKPALAK
jgi:hypothetical protein